LNDEIRIILIAAGMDIVKASYQQQNPNIIIPRYRTSSFIVSDEIEEA